MKRVSSARRSEVHLTDVFDELQGGVVEGQVGAGQHREHLRGQGHVPCAHHLLLDLLCDGEEVLGQLARDVLLREADHAWGGGSARGTTGSLYS